LHSTIRSEVTVNVGTVDGGLRPNVVAPEATATIGVRVPNTAAEAEVERAIRALQPTLEGSFLEVSGGMGRPPMDATPRNRELLATAQRLGRELGLDLEDAGLVGGASDANTTSLYTATLDGLGPVGDGGHAADEHVSISTIAKRAALLALLLVEPATEPTRLRRRRHEPHILVAAADTNETSTELVNAWRERGLQAELVPPPRLRASPPSDPILSGRGRPWVRVGPDRDSEKSTHMAQPPPASMVFIQALGGGCVLSA
jgi:hypothetical protein